MIGDDIHYVYANGVPLCSTRTLPKAVMLFMAIYYVFNMVVCKHAMRIVIFVLKLGCNIDNDVCDVYVWCAYKQCIVLFEKVTTKQTKKHNAGKVTGKQEMVLLLQSVEDKQERRTSGMDIGDQVFDAAVGGWTKILLNHKFSANIKVRVSTLVARWRKAKSTGLSKLKQVCSQTEQAKQMLVVSSHNRETKHWSFIITRQV